MNSLQKLKQKDCQKKEEPAVFCGSGFSSSHSSSSIVVAVTGGGVAYIYF